MVECSEAAGKLSPNGHAGPIGARLDRAFALTASCLKEHPFYECWATRDTYSVLREAWGFTSLLRRHSAARS